jgi:hypothetical protein
MSKKASISCGFPQRDQHHCPSALSKLQSLQMDRKPQKPEDYSMTLTDSDIKNAIRKRLSALDTLPEIIMPFDLEMDENGDDCVPTKKKR